MSDLFQDFRRNRLKTHLATLSLALVFALGLNVLVFNTPLGTNLRTSVNDVLSQPKPGRPDIVLEASGSGKHADLLNLVAGTQMQNVGRLKTTLIYDPKALHITNAMSQNPNANIIKNANLGGVAELIVEYKVPTTLAEGETILQLAYERTGSGASAINLAETGFKSGASEYLLTNQGTEIR